MYKKTPPFEYAAVFTSWTDKTAERILDVT